MKYIEIRFKIKKNPKVQYQPIRSYFNILYIELSQKYWAFVANWDFQLIPISLQPNVVGLGHFKLWILFDKKI